MKRKRVESNLENVYFGIHARAPPLGWMCLDSVGLTTALGIHAVTRFEVRYPFNHATGIIGIFVVLSSPCRYVIGTCATTLEAVRILDIGGQPLKHPKCDLRAQHYEDRGTNVLDSGRRVFDPCV